MQYAVAEMQEGRDCGYLVDGGEWRSRSGFSALGFFVVSMSMDVYNV